MKQAGRLFPGAACGGCEQPALHLRPSYICRISYSGYQDILFWLSGWRGYLLLSPPAQALRVEDESSRPGILERSQAEAQELRRMQQVPPRPPGSRCELSGSSSVTQIPLQPGAGPGHDTLDGSPAVCHPEVAVGSKVLDICEDSGVCYSLVCHCPFCMASVLSTGL
jgi:hypothetical protein